MPVISPKLSRRSVTEESIARFGVAGYSPLESRVLAARGADPEYVDLLALLNTPLRDLSLGALRIHAAIKHREPLVVIADYDCDGATSCAVAVSGLRALGATVDYVVPDRMVHGYGISPSVVDLARDSFPKAKVLITVDNGILGHSGISYANSLGLDVVVTDHHLPGESMPDAVAVIDPSRADCPSQLTKLAGVGVALMLVNAVKKLNVSAGLPAPPLGFLLPYVAIGTVADMVGLDAANRRLVMGGMAAMRSGAAPVGVAALIAEAGLTPSYLTTQDIGFGLGPRINAAGRLDTMDIGIDLLLATDPDKAASLAKTLSDTNAERKRLQRDSTEGAIDLSRIACKPDDMCIVQGDSSWHPGIIGLIASRLKDEFNLPSFVFSTADGVAKGSGRSIPGFHLKDALEELARRAPGVLAKFGGHAMAAGATLSSAEALNEFTDTFASIAKESITDEMRETTLWSDGEFPDISLEEGAQLLRHPWGQGFDAPGFDDVAVIKKATPMGADGIHWRLDTQIGAKKLPVQVVLFNQKNEPSIGEEVHLYLTPGLNTWKQKTGLQWLGKILA